MIEPDRSTDFGGRMKRLREQRGVSLRDIAEQTKISVTTLEALERNDVRRLPGGIFSRAVVRAYAEAVGADPEDGVRDFVQQFPHESLAGHSHAHRDHGSGDTRANRRTVIVMAIIVPLAAILVWTLLTLR
jgi:cytoskeletal protein RodZ